MNKIFTIKIGLRMLLDNRGRSVKERMSRGVNSRCPTIKQRYIMTGKTETKIQIDVAMRKRARKTKELTGKDEARTRLTEALKSTQIVKTRKLLDKKTILKNPDIKQKEAYNNNKENNKIPWVYQQMIKKGNKSKRIVHIRIIQIMKERNKRKSKQKLCKIIITTRNHKVQCRNFDSLRT